MTSRAGAPIGASFAGPLALGRVILISIPAIGTTVVLVSFAISAGPEGKPVQFSQQTPTLAAQTLIHIGPDTLLARFVALFKLIAEFSGIPGFTHAFPIHTLPRSIAAEGAYQAFADFSVVCTSEGA